MLISRISSKAYNGGSSSQSSVVSTSSGNTVISDRKGSLNYLWANFTKSVSWAFEQRNFVTQISCDILDSNERHWIPAVGKIQSNGVLLLREVNSDNILNSLSLLKCTVIGHLGQDLVQIFGTTTTFLLKCRKNDFALVCASLLAHAQLRPAGIEHKLWYPPPGQFLQDAGAVVLSTNVKAYFTPYNRYIQVPWAPFGASLSGTGDLKLVDSQNNCVYSLQIQKVLGSRINLVDSSLVGSNLVVLLFPDMGGPDTVYLRFSDRYECEEWVATLRALSLQPVASPLNHNPAQSVRWSKTLVVKVGYCESNANGESDTNKYLEICLNRWRFARTCIHYGPGDCNWNESFEFEGPESSIKAPTHIELKLRRMASNSDEPSEKDETIGSALLSVGQQNGGLVHSVDYNVASNSWEWYTLNPSNHKINVYVDEIETPVLDGSYYQNLSEWVTDLNLNLAAQLINYNSNAIPQLYPLFEKAYRARGLQLEWIFKMIGTEVHKLHTEDATLFRENSLFTKAVEGLLHQQGNVLLERTVGRFITKLVKTTTAPLELDPSKLANTDMLKFNQVSMTVCLDLLWSFIMHEKIPPLCRPVFRHFKSEFMKLGLSPLEARNAMHRTLAAFLFLRFYVPALLNPQHYNLTNRVLSPSHRRSLVLVAKILQAFANRVKFGNKEQWLTPMNVFIEKNQESLINWYGSQYGNATSEDDDDEERPPKQLPVTVFMGMELSSPSLIDERAVFSQLSNYIATGYDSSLTDEARKQIERNSLVSKVIRESKSIFDVQQKILQDLDQFDHIESCNKEHEPELYLNSETLLFGTNPEQLKPNTARDSRTASEKLSDEKSKISKKIGRILGIGKS